MSKIVVGDRVCYSKKFCQSTGQLTGDTPRARGKVVKLIPLGSSTTLAEIEWENVDCPPRVNTANLSRITPKRGIEEEN